MTKYIVIALAVVGAFVGGRLTGGEERIVYREVEVPAEAIQVNIPTPDLSFIEKAYRTALERSQRAVAPGGAQDRLDSFCAPTKEEPNLDKSTPKVVSSEPLKVPPQVVLTEVKLDKRFFRGYDVDLFGFTNQGDLIHDRYTGARGDIDAGVKEGETWVNSDRIDGTVLAETGTLVGVGVLLGLILSGL